MREKEGERDRQTDRQTDRDVGGQVRGRDTDEENKVSEENLEKGGKKGHELIVYQAHELFTIRVVKITTTHE